MAIEKKPRQNNKMPPHEILNPNDKFSNRRQYPISSVMQS